MTKGSGMIHPNMATTLGFVMMDAALPPSALAAMLAAAVKRSYNRISVDGDTSTNDTMLVLANGASGDAAQSEGKQESGRGADAGDGGPGAADRARWRGRSQAGDHRRDAAPSNEEAATRIARSIANSPLVKTAIAGSDPNWGRILSAAGQCGRAARSVQGGHRSARRAGVPGRTGRGFLRGRSEEEARRARLPDSFRDQRHEAKGSARFWTCDLTEKYIEINASYRT